jgi:hypothetical protein
MPKKLLALGCIIFLVGLAAGCGQQSSTSSKDQAAIDYINSDTSIYSVGDSDPSGQLDASSTSSEARPYIWFRAFQTPSSISIDLLSNDGTTAEARVTRTVSGTLDIQARPAAVAVIKSFSQNYTRYVALTSSNGGISWSRSGATPGLSKSTAVAAQSANSDLTITEVIITAAGTSGSTSTLYDVSSEASASGPWQNTVPIVAAGSTLEITVKASRAGDSATPFVYVWPGISTIFRRPLFDDGTHGDTVAGDGTFVNTAQPFSIPASETAGVKNITIGVFSSGTLSSASAAYDFSSWHFLYQVK